MSVIPAAADLPVVGGHHRHPSERSWVRTTGAQIRHVFRDDWDILGRTWREIVTAPDCFSEKKNVWSRAENWEVTVVTIKRVVWDAPSTTDRTKVRSLDLLISKAQPGPEWEGPTSEASYQLDARWHQRNQACICQGKMLAGNIWDCLFIS